MALIRLGGGCRITQSFLIILIPRPHSRLWNPVIDSQVFPVCAEAENFRQHYQGRRALCTLPPHPPSPGDLVCENTSGRTTADLQKIPRNSRVGQILEGWFVGHQGEGGALGKAAILQCGQESKKLTVDKIHAALSFIKYRR